MKITRDEAIQILEIHDGASDREIKKAYYKLAQEWHPDKHGEATKAEATEKFQRINAAYQRMTAAEQDSDDDDNFDFDEDIVFDFFAFMASRMGGMGMGGSSRQGASRRGRRGARMGGGGGGFGFSMGSGGIFFTPFGGGGGCDCRKCRRKYKEYMESSSSSEEEELDPEEIARRAEQRRQEEKEREEEREFLRKKNEERRRKNEERLRVEREAEYKREVAMRAAREKEEMQKKWLAQLPRPFQVSRSDTGFVLNVDNRKGDSRKSSFPRNIIPREYYWELEAKEVRKASGKGAQINWKPLPVVHGSLEVQVTGLLPGTKYVFRARSCVKVDAGEGNTKIKRSEWSPEAELMTTGTATRASASRKTKASQQQSTQADDEASLAAAEAAKEAQRLKDQAIQAALAAAAADYEAETAKLAPTEVAGAKEADESSATESKKQSKKKKKNKSSSSTEPAPVSEPVTAPSSRPPPPSSSSILPPATPASREPTEVEKAAAARGMSVELYINWKEQQDLIEAIKMSMQESDSHQETDIGRKPQQKQTQKQLQQKQKPKEQPQKQQVTKPARAPQPIKPANGNVKPIPYKPIPVPRGSVKGFSNGPAMPALASPSSDKLQHQNQNQSQQGINYNASQPYNSNNGMPYTTTSSSYSGGGQSAMPYNGFVPRPAETAAPPPPSAATLPNPSFGLFGDAPVTQGVESPDNGIGHLLPFLFPKT